MTQELCEEKPKRFGLGQHKNDSGIDSFCSLFEMDATSGRNAILSPRTAEELAFTLSGKAIID